jgi:electron transport complex protein RnfD
LGKNPFNPALVGRVFMLVSFPTAMTTWPQAQPIFEKGFFADAVTGPTPLGILKESGVGSLAETGDMQFLDMVLGNRGGAFGEVCAIALLLGAIYLLARRVIEFVTPLTILLTVFIFTGICHLVNPANFIAPWYHIVYGGLILGAFFMATDMVTTPMTIRGKILFGVGVGLITVVIRLWGAYPEGVSFAILIMNAFTPLINKAFKPYVFGVVKPSKK